MNVPRYSIIIPHHNTPSLLKRLLDSIPKRDDTEVIIVDDNSNPSIVDFKKFPGKERHDVRLCFDKKGGYGGYARNIGLALAKGEWVLFADSDDYFMYCLNEVLDDCYSIDEEVDLVFFCACSLDSERYIPTNRSKRLNKMIDEYRLNGAKSELLLRYKFGEPWCKLVRKCMIDKYQIRFEERSIHNDTAFSYLVGYHAKKIAVIPKAIYCITDRVGSVSKALSDSKKLERIENFGESSLFFKRHNIPVRENWHFYQLYECYNSNKEVYKQGTEILKNLGYSSINIYVGLLKAGVLSEVRHLYQSVFRQ